MSRKFNVECLLYLFTILLANCRWPEDVSIIANDVALPRRRYLILVAIVVEIAPHPSFQECNQPHIGNCVINEVDFFLASLLSSSIKAISANPIDWGLNAINSN